MTSQQLTLLQRGVIHRLREAGFTELANLAHEHWQAGRRIPESQAYRVAAWPDAARHTKLRADYERADAQSEEP